MSVLFSQIASEIDARPAQVEAAVALLDEGATVPFISRYRKEVTGGLDDTQLRKLQERLYYLRELEERREAILKSIKEQEKLTPELEKQIRGVGTKTERSVLSSKSGKVAPVICYESVFGEYVTGYIKKGAQAIFIMTNDGWWDNTAGHRQHLHFASLRAIETRRAIARSANTGISAFINQRGDILQATRYDEQAAIKGTIRFNDAITFYVVWGDAIARVALFTSILLLLNTFVRGRMKEKE